MMKKITFIFLMFVFLMPITAQSKLMGTFYEFMLDPSMPTTNSSNTMVHQ
mgnify:CR=1 FL=1